MYDMLRWTQSAERLQLYLVMRVFSGVNGMLVTVLRQSLPMLTLSSWRDSTDIHLHVRWDHIILKKHTNCGVLLKACKHSKLQRRSISETLSFSSLFFSLSGVPRQHRGEIWKFLSEQYLLKQEVPSAKPPNNDAPYKELLKQLTSQQHAILIDLG